MKFRRLSRIFAAALIAGGAFAAAPAVYAEEAPAPAAEQAQEPQSPFDAQAVQQHMMATIERFEKDDVAGLQAEAAADLRPHLTAETIKAAKEEFGPKWGSRVSLGLPHLTAGQENGAWYAICEIAIGYKETAVIYRLSYDEKMNLVGLFVR
jgi:hypothetical protein